MLDITKIKQPSSIELAGFFYDIKTDYRDWLNFARLLKTAENYAEFDFIYLDKIPKDRAAGFEKLLDFFNPQQLLPRPIGRNCNKRILDYDIDSDLIYSAFLEVYKIDLFETDGRGHALPLHWHKFNALIAGLHNTRLNEVMQYRSYDPNNKLSYEQQQAQLLQAWALPEIETATEKAAREEFNALLSKK